MKKSFVASLIFLAVQISLFAQTGNPERPAFHSINSIGLLNGSKGSSFSLQTIEGFSYRPFFAGLGAGLDFYKFRTVPLFIDLRYRPGHKKRNLYAYGDLGYNIPWLTDKEKESLFTTVNTKPAIYYDAGLGLYVPIKEDAFLLSIGYSYKEFKNLTKGYICTGSSCGVSDQKYRYQMQRVVIRVGWQF